MDISVTIFSKTDFHVSVALIKKRKYISDTLFPITYFKIYVESYSYSSLLNYFQSVPSVFNMIMLLLR